MNRLVGTNFTVPSGRQVFARKRTRTRFVFVYLLYFCFFPSLTFSKNLEGLALISVKSERVQLQNHMVVRLNPDRAQFVAIDELGGVSFVVDVDEARLQIHSPEGATHLKKKAMKQLLSLPIPKEEFLSVLNYDPSSLFLSRSSGDQEFWLHQKKKKLMISFQDFQHVRGDSKKYPHRIRIEYKKNFFEIVWQHLKFLD